MEDLVSRLLEHGEKHYNANHINDKCEDSPEINNSIERLFIQCLIVVHEKHQIFEQSYNDEDFDKGGDSDTHV